METPLKHTSLSCAQYAHGDSLGKLLAHIALAPVFLVCFQAARVYSRREVHETLLLVGMVAEEAAARALKHLLQHPRPPATCGMLHLCHSHGMPSSHTSMAFCYLAATTAAAAVLWARRGAASRLVSAAEQLLLAALAAGVAASRVYLGYHSTDQVLAGAAFGTAFGIAWHGLTAALAPLYPRVAAAWPLAQLGVKDTYGCGEPLLLEQQAHTAAAAGGSSSSRGGAQRGKAKAG